MSSLGREYPKQPIVSVGALVLKDGKILLVKRANEPGKGRWSIPGGVVELGERLEDAVKREVKEETNLDVSVGKMLDVVEVIRRDGMGNVVFHYVIIDYIASVVGGELFPSSDVEDARWVTIDEALNMDITESLRMMLKKIKDGSLIP